MNKGLKNEQGSMGIKEDGEQILIEEEEVGWFSVGKFCAVVSIRKALS